MLLMFRLGRPTCAPSDDFGVRKGYSNRLRTIDLPVTADRIPLLALEGHTSVRSWDLWRLTDSR